MKSFNQGKNVPTAWSGFLRCRILTVIAGAMLTLGAGADAAQTVVVSNGKVSRVVKISDGKIPPGFGEPGEGRWDGYQRINTETKSGGLVGVFRQNAAESSRQVTVRGLDPAARYAVVRAPEATPFATLTGAELAAQGFRVELKNRQDGELFEVLRQK